MKITKPTRSSQKSGKMGHHGPGPHSPPRASNSAAIVIIAIDLLRRSDGLYRINGSDMTHADGRSVGSRRPGRCSCGTPSGALSRAAYTAREARMETGDAP